MEKKTKLKKRILIGLLVLVILAAGAYVYTLLTEDETSNELLPAESYLYRYSDAPIDYDYVVIDTETDIYAYEPYLERDRSIYFKSGNSIIGYTMDEILARGDGLTLFGQYFRALMDADFDAHAALFADSEYFASAIPSRFSRQMLHNMEVEYLGDLEDLSFFCVRVAVLDNDGTYFLHLREDARQVLYFAVEDVGGEYKIRAIYDSVLAIYALANGT